MVEITPINALLVVFIPSTSLLVLAFVCSAFKKRCKACFVCLASEVLGDEVGCVIDMCGTDPEKTEDIPGSKVITKVTDMINETSPGGKHHTIHVTEAALATGLLCVKLPKNVKFVVHD